MINRLLAAMLLLTIVLPASARHIAIKGEISKFEREVVIRHLDRTIGKIVPLQYENGNYLVQQGDILMSFTRKDYNECGRTGDYSRYEYGETRDELIKIDYKQIAINLDCLDDFKEQNFYYAYMNSVLHEVACHAIGHTTWQEHLEFKKKYPKTLCVGSLSSDKLRWTKRDRRYMRRRLKND